MSRLRRYDFEYSLKLQEDYTEVITNNLIKKIKQIKEIKIPAKNENIFRHKKLKKIIKNILKRKKENNKKRRILLPTFFRIKMPQNIQVIMDKERIQRKVESNELELKKKNLKSYFLRKKLGKVRYKKRQLKKKRRIFKRNYFEKYNQKKPSKNNFYTLKGTRSNFYIKSLARNFNKKKRKKRRNFVLYKRNIAPKRSGIKSPVIFHKLFSYLRKKRKIKNMITQKNLKVSIYLRRRAIFIRRLYKNKKNWNKKLLDVKKNPIALKHLKKNLHSN